MTAAITSPYQSVPEMFVRRAEETAHLEAYRYPAGNQWQSLTWAQTLDRVRAIALGLHALGIQSLQRCAILSGTRIEWILADLGILCAGGATTTIYPSSTPDDCAYILTDSESRVVFAEDQAQVDKLTSQRAQLPNVVKVITFDGASDGDWVIRLDELEAQGHEIALSRPDLFGELVDGVQPEHMATLIYTSGTTGRPKGVRLVQANWLYEAEALKIRIGFTTAVDGNVDRRVDNLAVVRPTFMAAAPRIFEKVYNKVVTQAKSGGKLKYEILRWACDA